MTPDLLKEADAIARRLELGRSDAVARRWAEQDLRALALAFYVHALCAAGAVVVRTIAGVISGAFAARRQPDDLEPQKSPTAQ
jgi:hypothetical protein